MEVAELSNRHVAPVQNALFPCVGCAYPLSREQARGFCPECGWSDNRRSWRQARRWLLRPGHLCLRALTFWLPMPPGIWCSRINPRLIRVLAPSWRRELVFLLILSPFLFGLLGAFTVADCRMVDDGPPDGSILRETNCDICGQRDLSWWDSRDPETQQEYIDQLLVWPTHRLRWGSRWGQTSLGIVFDYRTEIYRMLPIIEIITVSLANWSLTACLVYLLTQRTSFIAQDADELVVNRNAARNSVLYACLVPIRVAWIAAFLLVIPLLLAPIETAAFRSAAWYVLTAIAIVLPAVIAARAIQADKPGLYVRRRLLAAITFLVLGAAAPWALFHYYLLPPFAWWAYRGFA